MRKRWWLIVGLVLLILLTNLLFWAYLFDGFAWSSKHIRFEQILCALPYWPDTLGPCNTGVNDVLGVSGAPNNCFLRGEYSVDIEHSEVVNFYDFQLGNLGWVVVSKDETASSSYPDSYYYRITRHLFESIQRHWVTKKSYWLMVDIATPVNVDDGLRTDDTMVNMLVSDERDCFKPWFDFAD